MARAAPLRSGRPWRASGDFTKRGYAMAALLVSLAVMSVLMGALLPAWRHQAQREKEAELVFRGEQYVRAIRLWEMKMGPGSRPPNFDILVQQKFLRKKYKDPMTEDGEFQPLYVGANLPAPGGPGRADAVRASPGAGGRGPSGPVQRPGNNAAAASTAQQPGIGGQSGEGEFLAWPARARKPRSSSTKAGRITTSGPSCSPTRRRLPAGWAARCRAVAAAVRFRAAGAFPVAAVRVAAEFSQAESAASVRAAAAPSSTRAWSLQADAARLAEQTALAARGDGAAFDGRCIPAGGVTPPLNTPGIRGRRALPAGRLARLGATPAFHHGLLARSFDGGAVVPAGENRHHLLMASTTASWMRGRSSRIALFSRVGWTRFVSRTT